MARQDPIVIDGEDMSLYRLKGDGATIYSLTRGRNQGEHFRKLKKAHDIPAALADRYMVAAVRCIAHFMERENLDLITCPPHSGDGPSFAQAIAQAVAKHGGRKYAAIFQDHDQGKRYLRGAKFRPIKYEVTIWLPVVSVLVFDDFTYTRRTIAGAMTELSSNRTARVEGIVLNGK